VALALSATLLGLAFGASGALAAGEPVNRQAPTLSQSGSTLTTTDGMWVGVTRPFTYSWFRCADASVDSCLEVPGQTAKTYAITGLDAGNRIRSRVTGSNPFGSASAFSAPTAAFPVAGTAPSRPTDPRSPRAPASLPRLSPFPVVVVTGRTRGARTRITGLLVRGPAGARVTTSCRMRCHVPTRSTTIGAKRRVRLHRAERLYRSGALLELRVTGRGRVGKYTRLRIRTGVAPARTDRCLRPGSSTPVRCS
jgi:hypothetical protein